MAGGAETGVVTAVTVEGAAGAAIRSAELASAYTPELGDVADSRGTALTVAGAGGMRRAIARTASAAVAEENATAVSVGSANC